MTLSITWQQTTNQSVVLTVHGEIDYVSASSLRAAISAAAAGHPRPPTIVVDLGHVDSIDALGVGTLGVGNRICKQIGIDLAVRHPSPLIRRVLGMAGRDRGNRLHPRAGAIPQTQVRIGSAGSG